MIANQVSLPRQMDMVFRKLRRELSQVHAGTLLIQIRNNMIGKFGIRHMPFDGGLKDRMERIGLEPDQIRLFRDMAVHALEKKHWAYGEIMFDFALRNGMLQISVQLESNYNLAAILTRD